MLGPGGTRGHRRPDRDRRGEGGPVTTPSGIDTPRFPFALDRCVVADVETYPNHWCVGFHGPDSEGRLTTWIVDGDRDQLAKVLARLAERDKILVSFNGDHF